MTNVNNLQELIDNRKVAYDAFKANEKLTADALLELLKLHCPVEGFKIEARFNFSTTWRREKYGRYVFHADVGFVTDDPARIAKGWTTDFGSDFDLYIYEEGGIEINKGTCGSYTRKDKYQVARDLMLAKIWGVEDILINKMKELCDFNLYDTFMDLDNQIDRIQRDIENAEQKRKEDEMLKTLRGAKYLYTESICDAYKDDDYWTHEVIGKKHHFYDIFVIEKITDKSVIGHYELYRWENKRLPVSTIIYQLLIRILTE